MIPPLFSIIIPTFNSAKSLQECLESVLRQSFRNFEVLIIDGLSMDETLQIASSFDDDRIKVYSSKDNGIYDAMNKGIKLAKGEWLYFLGSDDYLFPDVLNEISAVVIKTKKVDLIYGNIHVQGHSLPTKLKMNKYDIVKGTICHQAIFYKTKLFPEFGLYSLDYKYISDWIFNSKIFLSKKYTKHIDITIAIYGTFGESSVNMSATNQEFAAYRKILIKNLSSKKFFELKFYNQLQKISKLFRHLNCPL